MKRFIFAGLLTW